jgi:GYF domain 2
MADQWYFAWDNQKFGPFSAAQLKELAALGRLQPKDLVWKNDIERGVAADKVKHLFSDPCATILSMNTGVADLSSTQQPPNNLVASISNELANVGLLPMNGPGTPDGLQPALPDGLSLRAIPEQCEKTPAVSPPAVNSPRTERNGEQARETSPDLTSTADEKPEIPPSANKPTDSQKKRVCKGRATVLKGAVIVSQDGEYVKYRKKCTQCGHEDSCTRAMPITNGVSRDTFFCTKCRKKREVVIQGKK